MSKAFDNIFPVGLGTARFPFSNVETYDTDFENAVNLVLHALDSGVNYIDVGKGYSNNEAFSVLKEAFRRTDKKFYTTVKVTSYDAKVTAERYYQEAMFVLEQLGLEKASHFLLWTLMDSNHFHAAVGKNSLYDAALRLKEEGKIEYIGASLHMQYDDIIEVIDSGLFEFLLISYNLMNFLDMQKVLDHAYEKGVDILVMNPLYGGLIPENSHLFEYAKYSENESVVQAAVRALLAHPAVKCVLAGASSKEQLDEYLSAVKEPGFEEESHRGRIQHIKDSVMNSAVFCSYCRYCEGCPKNIPVPQIMNTRNCLALQEHNSLDSTEKLFFQVLHEKYDVVFETAENPCIRCGRCEKKCTQHLNIMDSIDEVYKIVKNTGYDRQSRKNRFDTLLHGCGYQKIGFWPASAGTMKILDIYQDLFGEIPFDVVLFDSNEELHGKERFGHIVHKKEEAVELGVNCILITSYNYGTAIREQIKDLEDRGVDVKVLYQKGDVDWWWAL